MARTRSISSAEAEVARLEAALNKAQKKVDDLTEQLLEAQKVKQELETRKIMDAYRKSGRSLQEVMTFLNV